MRVNSSLFGERRTFISTIGAPFGSISATISMALPRTFSSTISSLAGRCHGVDARVARRAATRCRRPARCPDLSSSTSVRRRGSVMIWFQPSVGLAGFMLKMTITPPLPSGRRTARARRRARLGPKLKSPPSVTTNLSRSCVVVAQQVLAAAHVAEVQQDVPVADGPEIGARAVVADQRVLIVFSANGCRYSHLARSLERNRKSARTGLPPGPRQRAAGQRVVQLALLPDARIEDAVGQRRAVGLGMGMTAWPVTFLPVQQQRIAGDGHHVADLRAVIHGDHAVLFDQGRAGVAFVLRVAGRWPAGRSRQWIRSSLTAWPQCCRGSSGG